MKPSILFSNPKSLLYRLAADAGITFLVVTFGVTLAPAQVEKKTNAALVTSHSFTNPNQIVINDAAAAAPYGSEITVAGLGVVQNVSIKLNGVTHERFDDVGVLLVGPTGQKIKLAADTGGSYPLDRLDLTLDDTAPSFLPDDAQIIAGSYRPASQTDEGGGKTHPQDFPSPAPSSPYSDSLSVLTGTNPNGIWRLYVDDDSFGIGGAIELGWSLEIEASAPTPAAANICGRVVTNDGRGISKANMMIIGGYLESPMSASSNPFGYFCFPEMYVGQSYTISASSKRYSFKNGVQFVVLLDGVNDMLFVAEP